VAKSNLPTVRVGDKEVTVNQMLSSRITQINAVLPEASGMTGEQLARIAQMEVIRNSDLAACNPTTIMNSVYDAARLGLLIGREAHLVPYAKQCKMIPDFRGFITLVYRSGLVSWIDAKNVFPEDEFTVQEGTEMAIHHIPDYSIDREIGENILFSYAVATIIGAPYPIFHVMNRAAIDKIRESSAMKNAEPWSKWYDRMSVKSALKYLCDKRLPATKIRGLTELIALDNMAETGEARGAMVWDSDEDARATLASNTANRQEELKQRLAAKADDDDMSAEPTGEPEEPKPEVLSSTEDADRQAREDDARLAAEEEKKETKKGTNKGGKQ